MAADTPLTPQEVQALLELERAGKMPPEALAAIDTLRRTGEIQGKPAELSMEGRRSSDVDVLGAKGRVVPLAPSAVQATSAAQVQDPRSAFQEEALPTLGGTLGSIVGSRLGPPGAAVAAGGGAMLGLAATPYVFGGPRPSLVELAITGGTAGAAELGMRGLGSAVSGAGRRVAPGLTSAAVEPEAQAAAAGAARLGMDPLAPSVVGRESLAILEQEAAGTVTGRPVVRAAIRRQLADLDVAVENFGRALGQAADREMVRTAVMAALDRSHRTATGLTDQVWAGFRTLGKSALPVVDVAPVRTKALELANATAEPGLKSSLLSIAKGPASVPFQDADALRTMFAKASRESPGVYGAGGAPALHKAIEESFEQAATAKGVPDVVDALRLARAASADEHRLYTYSEIGKRLRASERGATAVGVPGKSGKPEPLAKVLTMEPSQIRIMREAVTGSPTGMNPAWQMVRRRALSDALDAATTYSKGLRQQAIDGPRFSKFLRDHDAQLQQLLSSGEHQLMRDIGAVAEGLSSQTGRIGTGYGRQRFTTGTVSLLAGGAALGSAVAGLGIVSSGVGAGAAYLIVPPIVARIVTDQVAARRAAMALGVLRQVVGVGGRVGFQGGAAAGSTAISDRLRGPAPPLR